MFFRNTSSRAASVSLLESSSKYSCWGNDFIDANGSGQEQKPLRSNTSSNETPVPDFFSLMLSLMLSLQALSSQDRDTVHSSGLRPVSLSWMTRDLVSHREHTRRETTLLMSPVRSFFSRAQIASATVLTVHPSTVRRMSPGFKSLPAKILEGAILLMHTSEFLWSFTSNSIPLNEQDEPVARFRPAT